MGSAGGRVMLKTAHFKRIHRWLATISKAQIAMDKDKHTLIASELIVVMPWLLTVVENKVFYFCFVFLRKFNNKRCATIIVLCSSGWMHIARKTGFPTHFCLVLLISVNKKEKLKKKKGSRWSRNHGSRICVVVRWNLKIVFFRMSYSHNNQWSLHSDRCAMEASAVTRSNGAVFPGSVPFLLSRHFRLSWWVSQVCFQPFPASGWLCGPTTLNWFQVHVRLKTVLYRAGSML